MWFFFAFKSVITSAIEPNALVLPHPPPHPPVFHSDKERNKVHFSHLLTDSCSGTLRWMLDSDQRTQAKLTRSASTWKGNERFVMWEALLFLGSFLCEMCFPFLFLNKERMETLQSSSEHSKLWRSGLFGSQFLKYSNVSLSFFPVPYLTEHTHLGAVSLAAFCQRSPRQPTVSHGVCHAGTRRLGRLLATRTFQDGVSARNPYVRGHRGALWPSAHI